MWSDDTLLSTVGEFVLAAFESSSALLLNLLHQLKKHPDAERRLRKEINAQFPGAGRAPTVEGISRMEYLSCVVKECLRLFPS